MNLVAPHKKIVLKPVRPNLGVAAKYDAALQKLINEMQADILKSISTVYTEKPPHAEFAQDSSPAMRLRDEMVRLTRKWSKVFAIAAPELAQVFSLGALTHADMAFKKVLVQSGFSVKFKMTRPMNDAYQAVAGENIGLIKSIGSQHLSDVQGMVMRSVQEGRSMAALTKELGPLVKLAPKAGETARNLLARTKRRAALIARDQNNKASAVFTRIRQQELGITKAIWRHSGAGKVPRPEHLAFDGKEYEVAIGAPIADDGGMTWPGIEIQCRCYSNSVVSRFNE